MNPRPGWLFAVPPFRSRPRREGKGGEERTRQNASTLLERNASGLCTHPTRRSRPLRSRSRRSCEVVSFAIRCVFRVAIAEVADASCTALRKPVSICLDTDKGRNPRTRWPSLAAAAFSIDAMAGLRPASRHARSGRRLVAAVTGVRVTAQGGAAAPSSGGNLPGSGLSVSRFVPILSRRLITPSLLEKRVLRTLMPGTTGGAPSGVSPVVRSRSLATKALGTLWLPYFRAGGNRKPGAKTLRSRLPQVSVVSFDSRLSPLVSDGSGWCQPSSDLIVRKHDSITLKVCQGVGVHTI